MDSKKALLIVNPCAGRNNKRLGALEIVKKFSPPEWETEIRTTRCQGDATTIVKDEVQNTMLFFAAEATEHLTKSLTDL